MAKQQGRNHENNAQKIKQFGIIRIRHKLNNSEVRLSPELSISSGINEQIEDPYWKKDIYTPLEASISKQNIIKSTINSPSEHSTSRKRDIKSQLLIPFTLKFNNEHKLIAIPSPKKHN